MQISLIVLPALYAMFLLNLLKIESLMKLMEITLICTVIAYFIEPGHRIIDFINIKGELDGSFYYPFKKFHRK